MTRSELLAEFLKLDPEEQRQLVDEMWDSIDEDRPLTEAQAAEVKRRIDEHERDPSTAIPWETVRARLWSRFK
jgi:putative addiction module component (TIGR02574 family)